MILLASVPALGGREGSGLRLHGDVCFYLHPLYFVIICFSSVLFVRCVGWALMPSTPARRRYR